MLEKIAIRHYKCLQEELVEFKPLTILTGKNNSGKSSILQTVLLAARNCNPKNRERMYDVVSKYLDIKYNFEMFINGDTIICKNAEYDLFKDENTLLFEENLFYLTSNRVGQEDIVKSNMQYKVGNNGEFLFGALWNFFADNVHFDMSVHDCNKLIDMCSNPHVIYNVRKSMLKFLYTDSSGECKNEEFLSKVDDHKNIDEIVRDEAFRMQHDIASSLYNAVMTLPVAINCWLSYIADSPTIIISEYVTAGTCKVYFRQNDVEEEINPFNVGSGLSYLAKVLILCFLAKPGDVVIIENPEIHLHPGAQSRLGEFFCFLASKGIQLIVETHCEHLLNSLRYQVYKEQIASTDVIIYYKENAKRHFEKILIARDGYYANTKNQKITFPQGFFDISVQKLMELGL